ncbi:protease [Xanthomonas translucens pv. arrhenatheri]|uniref:Extracellular protease n=1 Tax=Xanthomonas graminis pv. arrhenatheri LMG 727 TaxID=1195923 RepID=A0A0K2ZLZ2_9XANT|nr:M35 family metallo-endopeptidase [Xanthomonas translucens]OAX66857.1 protease [Xanthomonas translucens pv. arrhenatheri]UKE76343.1 protease [Xanthomonas translucens pv. arrhenatheri]CTP85977.1 extracellular protease [Xanthomonas translucens pv. arrhenatheri LMG 727]
MKHASLISAAIGFSLVGLISAATAQSQLTQNTTPLQVELAPVADADGQYRGQVAVTVRNSGERVARVPKWELPLGELDASLFEVQRDGRAVDYVGRLVKRAAPRAEDFVTLQQGEARHAQIDLGNAYDLSRSGNYTITLNASLQYAAFADGARMQRADSQPQTLSSAPLTLWLDGRGRALRNELMAGPQAVVNGINYASCSSSQISTIGSAVNSARTYSQNAKTYLNGGSTGARYTSWFGAYNASRYSTASSNFVNIDAAIDQNNGQITINCGCSESSYAYVSPNQPYQIYVCNAFWSAPLTGTNSKAGTLIHEMSHFSVVAGTSDYAYGQSAARSLASSNPARAVKNADNHEYFAENSPAQN